MTDSDLFDFDNTPDKTGIDLDAFKQTLRPIDRQRIDAVHEIYSTSPDSNNIWYIHSVLAQCFLPYRDPKTRDWDRNNGDFSVSLSAGRMKNPETGEFEVVGLPYGAKPRLFQSYICTQAMRQRTRVISVERSMSAMLKELGMQVTGGKEGTITRFKEQVTRFALCRFQLVGPGPKANFRRYINAEPIKRFDVWFPPHPDQETLWPSEIELTADFYDNLIQHAIPYDFRGLKAIQSNPRAQDIYLWMTQRLCRLSNNKPLFMTWPMLFEMFGGTTKNLKHFKTDFKKTLLAAKSAYPEAQIEEEEQGYRFRASPPPVPRTKIST